MGRKEASGLSQGCEAHACVERRQPRTGTSVPGGHRSAWGLSWTLRRAAARSPKPTDWALNPLEVKRNIVILKELKEMNKEIISN